MQIKDKVLDVPVIQGGMGGGKMSEFLFHPLQVQSQQMGHVELSVLLMQVMMNRILRAAPLRRI